MEEATTKIVGKFFSDIKLQKQQQQRKKLVRQSESLGHKQTKKATTNHHQHDEEAQQLLHQEHQQHQQQQHQQQQQQQNFKLKKAESNFIARTGSAGMGGGFTIPQQAVTSATLLRHQQQQHIANTQKTKLPTTFSNSNNNNNNNLQTQMHEKLLANKDEQQQQQTSKEKTEIKNPPTQQATLSSSATTVATTATTTTITTTATTTTTSRGTKFAEKLRHSFRRGEHKSLEIKRSEHYCQQQQQQQRLRGLQLLHSKRHSQSIFSLHNLPGSCGNGSGSGSASASNNGAATGHINPALLLDSPDEGTPPEYTYQHLSSVATTNSSTSLESNFDLGENNYSPQTNICYWAWQQSLQQQQTQSMGGEISSTANGRATTATTAAKTLSSSQDGSGVAVPGETETHSKRKLAAQSSSRSDSHTQQQQQYHGPLPPHGAVSRSCSITSESSSTKLTRLQNFLFKSSNESSKSYQGHSNEGFTLSSHNSSSGEWENLSNFATSSSGNPAAPEFHVGSFPEETSVSELAELGETDGGSVAAGGGVDGGGSYYQYTLTSPNNPFLPEIIAHTYHSNYNDEQQQPQLQPQPHEQQPQHHHQHYHHHLPASMVYHQQQQQQQQHHHYDELDASVTAVKYIRGGGGTGGTRSAQLPTPAYSRTGSQESTQSEGGGAVVHQHHQPQSQTSSSSTSSTPGRHKRKLFSLHSPNRHFQQHQQQHQQQQQQQHNDQQAVSAQSTVGTGNTVSSSFDSSTTTTITARPTSASGNNIVHSLNPFLPTIQQTSSGSNEAVSCYSGSPPATTTFASASPTSSSSSLVKRVPLKQCAAIMSPTTVAAAAATSILTAPPSVPQDLNAKREEFLRATMKICLVVSPPTSKLQLKSKSLTHLDGLDTTIACSHGSAGVATNPHTSYQQYAAVGGSTPTPATATTTAAANATIMPHVGSSKAPPNNYNNNNNNSHNKNNFNINQQSNSNISKNTLLESSSNNKHVPQTTTLTTIRTPMVGTNATITTTTSMSQHHQPQSINLNKLTASLAATTCAPATNALAPQQRLLAKSIKLSTTLPTTVHQQHIVSSHNVNKIAYHHHQSLPPPQQPPPLQSSSSFYNDHQEQQHKQHQQQNQLKATTTTITTTITNISPLLALSSSSSCCNNTSICCLGGGTTTAVTSSNNAVIVVVSVANTNTTTATATTIQHLQINSSSNNNNNRNNKYQQHNRCDYHYDGHGAAGGGVDANSCSFLTNSISQNELYSSAPPLLPATEHTSKKKLSFLQRQSKKKPLLTRSEVSSSEYFSVTFCTEPGYQDEEFIPVTRGVTLAMALSPALQQRNLSFSQITITDNNATASSSFLEAVYSPLPMVSSLDENTDVENLSGRHLIVMDRESTRKTLQKAASFGARPRPPRLLSSASTEETSESNALPGKKQRWSSLFAVKNPHQSQLCELLNSYAKQGVPQRCASLNYDHPNFDAALEYLDNMHRSWRDFVCSEGMADAKTKIQTAIWELVTTEVLYIHALQTVTDLFLACLEAIQDEGLLHDVDQHRLFSNVRDICEANLKFWTYYLYPMVAHSVATQEPMSIAFFQQGFELFGTIFAPYKKYCAEQSTCQFYCKELNRTNSLFTSYLAWCESQKMCNRLRLADILVRPMQRLTKYSLLLTAIKKHMSDVDEIYAVDRMVQTVENFVYSVNSHLTTRQEMERLKGVMARIESYDVLETNNEQLEKMIKNHSQMFDLCAPMKGCAMHHVRHLFMEGDHKFKDHMGKTDVHCFLLTDMLLVCKTVAKKGFGALKVIRQPYITDRLVVHLANNVLHCIYLNDFQMAIAAFTLQCSEAKNWYESLNRAKMIYTRLKQGATQNWETFRFGSSTGSGSGGGNGNPGSGTAGVSGIGGLGGGATIDSLAVKKSPMNSSIGSHVSSANNSHSGSVEWNDSRNISVDFEKTNSLSSDEGSSLMGVQAFALKGKNVTPVGNQHKLKIVTSSANTLAVQPHLHLGQSLPNLNLHHSHTNFNRTSSTNTLHVPGTTTSHSGLLLSPSYRGTSYPPPSPTRVPLRRGMAFSTSTKNPPLVKTRNITSQNSINWHQIPATPTSPNAQQTQQYNCTGTTATSITEETPQESELETTAITGTMATTPTTLATEPEIAPLQFITDVTDAAITMPTVNQCSTETDV